MRSSADGFTVLELLVAAGIAALMMSLAMVALTTTTRAHKRSRRLLIEEEEARLALSRIRRDVEGLFEAKAGWGNCFRILDGDRKLEIMCSTENKGASDYARASYYVDDGDGDGKPEELVREVLAWPSETASFDFTGDGEKQIVARNVRRVRFESDGSMPPQWVKASVTMKRGEMSTMEREGFISGGGDVGELYEIRWYEETVYVPAGQ